MERLNEILLSTARNGQTHMVTHHIKNGASVNCTGKYGNTPLHCAAEGGHVKTINVLLEAGADVAVRNIHGKTPLHFAALRGYDSIVKLLLVAGSDVSVRNSDRMIPLHYAADQGYDKTVKILLEAGSDVAARDINGMTPLHCAVLGGYDKIIKILIEAHSDVRTKDHDDRTPLHDAALGGYDKIVKLLIEAGSDVLVRNSDGNTPLHCAVVGGHKKVVEFLVSAKSDVSACNNLNMTPLSYAALRGNDKIVKVLVTTDYLGRKHKDFTTDINSLIQAEIEKIQKDIPDVIMKMDNRSLNIYKNMLQKGTERRRDIRIILVGRKKSGKTSLVRNLLGQDLNNVTDTNGIEIHVKKCRIRCKDGTWDSHFDDYVESCNSRLKKTYTDFVRPVSEPEGATSGLQRNEDIDEDASDILQPVVSDTDNLLTEGHMDKQSSSYQINTDPKSFVSQKGVTQKDNNTIDNLDGPIKESFRKVLQARHTMDEFANVFIWDFAGDEEFYNTHQMFFAREVIYLVLTKLNGECTEKAGAFKFWFESIHCLCENSSNDAEEALNPPVIVVGTHTDMLEDNQEKCEECLTVIYEDVSPDLRKHIRDYILLSNIKHPDEKINELRQKIFETATKAKNWDAILPVKFILLEEKLEGHKIMETPILSFTDVEQIAKETDQPITKQEELDLFLRYHHEIGNLIYFADLPKYVILNPQWLADIFKSVVTAEKFQLKHPGFDWTEVKNTGRLNKKLLDKILSKQTEITEQQSFLLKVLEKFDILVRPHILAAGKTVTKCEEYYVPCMVKAVPSDEIDKLFEDLKPKSKSFMLCLKFGFLPPTVFNRLLVSCCRKDDFTSTKIKIKDKVQFAFFRDMAVFDITSDGCAKLVVARFDNIIHLQVLNFGTKLVSLNKIREFVIGEVKRISLHRFGSKQLTFETNMKCPNSKFDSLESMRPYTKEMNIEEYFCTEHAEVHTLKDDWFGCQSPKQLSTDQLNFAKMGMVSLDIFGDVLYDLLKLDTPAVPNRSTCDVTFLYKEHRTLNKHVPSTKRWGGGKLVEDVVQHFKQIGDDIERIRLIRNEIAHSKSYLIQYQRFKELYSFTTDLLNRFDTHIKPSKPYLHRLEEINRMTFTITELEQVLEKLSQDGQGSSYYYAENIKVEHHHYYK